MAEYWFENPRKARTHRKRTRPRRRKNSGGMGGLLMLANRKRRRSTRRKRAMPAGLKAYWANRRRRSTHRRRRHNPKLRVRHAILTNRRRVRRHRRNPASVGAAPSSVKGFLSTSFLLTAAVGAAGFVAPSYFTDRILPMFGFTLTGIPRRLAGLVPAAAVVMFGKKFVGKHAGPFVFGSAAATALGVVNDFTGGLVAAPMLGRYSRQPAVAGGVGMGRYSQQPRVLATH